MTAITVNILLFLITLWHRCCRSFQLVLRKVLRVLSWYHYIVPYFFVLLTFSLFLPIYFTLSFLLEKGFYGNRIAIATRKRHSTRTYVHRVASLYSLPFYPLAAFFIASGRPSALPSCCPCRRGCRSCHNLERESWAVITFLTTTSLAPDSEATNPLRANTTTLWLIW